MRDHVAHASAPEVLILKVTSNTGEVQKQTLVSRALATSSEFSSLVDLNQSSSYATRGLVNMNIFGSESQEWSADTAGLRTTRRGTER